MKIERLQLRNFQSYESADLAFDEGLTLIHGTNGAGKSTILRGIFGGLYQTDATTETSSDYSLADLVTRGEKEGSVLLSFSLGGTAYTINWVIEVEEENGERKGSTKKCTLTSTGMSESIEGVRAVRSYVKDLLGMGATEFASSVYVQQKRFSRLIEASDTERKEILDGLLGFDEIDEYISRTKSARRPVKKKRSNAQAKLQEVRSRISDYDEDDLLEQRKQLKEDISRTKSDLSEAEEKMNRLEGGYEDAQERIQRYKDRIDRKKELEEKIDEKTEKIDNLKSKIEEKKDEIGSLASQIEDLEHSTSKSPHGDKQEAEDALDKKQDRKNKLYKQLQNKQSELKSHKSDLEDIQDKISEKESEKDRIKEEKQSVERQINELFEGPSEQAPLTEAGLTQEITKWLEDNDIAIETNNSDVDDLLNEIQKRLRDREKALRDALSTVEASVESLEQEVGEMEEELKENKEDMSRMREKVDASGDPVSLYEDAIDRAVGVSDTLDIEVHRDDVAKSIDNAIHTGANDYLNEYHERAMQGAAKEILDEKREDIEQTHEVISALSEALQYNTLVRVHKTVTQLESTIEENKEEIENKQEKIKQKEKEMKDIEALQSTLQNYEEINERVEEHATLAEEIEDITEERDDLETEEQEIENEIEEVQEEVEDIQTEYDEVRQSIEDTEDVVNRFQNIEQMEDKVDHKRQEIGQINERINDLRDTVNDHQESLERVERELGDKTKEELQDRTERAKEAYDKMEGKVEKLDGKLDKKNKELVQVNQKIENLEEEREREQELSEKAGKYDDVVEDLTEMIEVYESVKLDLREETLGLLNKYTNEVFEDLYENESYVAVEIDKNYNVSLITADNEKIDPDKCSGGEGVLTNIALRAGVYRVISERDESGGSALPPFILDEPTNHLDDEHVSQIQNAIQSIQDWDVPQVFVVSHRESLLTKSDHKLHVQRDNTTGMSNAVFEDRQ